MYFICGGIFIPLPLIIAPMNLEKIYIYVVNENILLGVGLVNKNTILKTSLVVSICLEGLLWCQISFSMYLNEMGKCKDKFEGIKIISQ